MDSPNDDQNQNNNGLDSIASKQPNLQTDVTLEKPKTKKNLILIIIQILIIIIAVIQILIAVMPFIIGQGSSIDSYLKSKYNLSKGQYSIISSADDTVADTYKLVDKDGNKFEVINYGTKAQPNYMDNYQKHQFDEDVLKLLSKYTSLKIAHIDNDYDLNGFLKDVYNRNPADYVKGYGSGCSAWVGAYPIRVWVAANESNSESILGEIKKDIVPMSDAIGCGIKVYEVKDTVTDYSNLDYIWNEESTYGPVKEYSKDKFFYVVLYSKIGRSNLIINTKTGEREYYWGKIQ